MTHYARRYNMFKEFASNRGKWYWTIVPSYLWVTFFKNMWYICSFPVSGNVTRVQRYLKNNLVIKRAITKLICFKKMAFTRSGPHALWMFSIDKKLKTPSSVMTHIRAWTVIFVWLFWCNCFSCKYRFKLTVQNLCFIQVIRYFHALHYPLG